MQCPDYDAANGFVRPVRRTYVHTGCYKMTRIPLDVAENFARDPSFYTTTFCHHCQAQHPVAEFGWHDGDIVGT